MNSPNCQKSQMQAQVQDVKEQKHLYYNLIKANAKIENPKINFEKKEIIYDIEMNGDKGSISYNCESGYVSLKNNKGVETERFIIQGQCEGDKIFLKKIYTDLKKILKEENKKGI